MVASAYGTVAVVVVVVVVAVVVAVVAVVVVIVVFFNGDQNQLGITIVKGLLIPSWSMSSSCCRDKVAVNT